MSWKKVVLPIAVLIVGAVATLAIVRMAPEVETVVSEPTVPLVRSIVAEKSRVRLEVLSQGTVRPRTEADLAAEVSGSVVWTSPAFESGGFFEKGQVLLRLDGRDYAVGLASAEAQLAQARVRHAREEAEAKMAVEEWQELGDGQPPPLVRREPQLAEATAGIQAAEAVLAKAQLDLDRTELRAPFSGRVRQKLADVGQFLNRGEPVGRVYAVDYVEIRLPVSNGDLAYLDLALFGRASSDLGGPSVLIETDFAGARHSWRARIVRTEGEIDPKSRMLHLVARVEDPYRVDDEHPNRPPLAVGLFVEATIEGNWAEDIVRVPRSAMRSDDVLLVIDGDDRLRFREVEVLRRDPEAVLVASGLESGERVCVSSLDAVVDGMRVRTEEGTS